MDTTPTLIAQPRIDCLTTSPTTGESLRLTMYTGTITIGGPPSLLGSPLTFGEGVGTSARYQGPVWLPDSLPYRAALLAGAAPTVQLGLMVTGAQVTVGVQAGVSFAPDPRGGDLTFVCLALDAHIRLGVAVSYQVTTLVPVAAVPPPTG